MVERISFGREGVSGLILVRDTGVIARGRRRRGRGDSGVSFPGHFLSGCGIDVRVFNRVMFG